MSISQHSDLIRALNEDRSTIIFALCRMAQDSGNKIRTYITQDGRYVSIDFPVGTACFRIHIDDWDPFSVFIEEEASSPPISLPEVRMELLKKL